MTHDHRDQAPRSVARAHGDRRALPAVDRALRDLRDAAELVAFLALLRDPQTARPWRETHLDAEARAELDYAARAELAERTADAPGEHTDAARPDVLDALSGLLRRAEDLARDLSRAAWCPVLPPAPAAADPYPYLVHAAACLPAACLAWTNGDEIAHYAASEAAAMRADLEHRLALDVDGHTVKAVCPWCHGGLAGRYSWRVRIVPGGEPAIVCESGLCNPPTRDVTTWWAGVPVWPLRDWPWLARRARHLDARRDAETPLPPPRAGAQGATGRAGAPVTDTAAREVLAGRLDEDAITSTKYRN